GTRPLPDSWGGSYYRRRDGTRIGREGRMVMDLIRVHLFFPPHPCSDSRRPKGFRREMKTELTRWLSSSFLSLALAACVAAQTPQPANPRSNGPVKVDSETISGLGARNIGSAAMSGRVAAVDAVREGQRLTVYVGAASGGVWKSVNGGTTYKPVFDKQPVQSIGAVAVDPKNPKTVWVGTGEAWTRNSVSVGDGVYKSTDGGENWTNVGLRDSERIAKILVDPSNTDTAYVCATGKLWSDSDERGVYKTTDGGKTWAK